jgi:hypothetical protein
MSTANSSAAPNSVFVQLLRNEKILTQRLRQYHLNDSYFARFIADFARLPMAKHRQVYFQFLDTITETSITVSFEYFGQIKKDGHF